MTKVKQYVFSARTTEEGLKRLGVEKVKLGVNWDELVVEAVSAHYGIDKAMMTLPKKEKPPNEAVEPVPTGEKECSSEAIQEETPVKKQAKKNKRSASLKVEATGIQEHTEVKRK